MGENKRIFLTGALIAGLLLLTPFYLQMIGVQPDVESVQQSPESFDNTNASGFDVANASSIEPSVSKIDVDQSSLIKTTHKGSTESKKINILTSRLDLILSNHGGGSIQSATLVSDNIYDGYKYVGSYDEQDVYNDSINVSLILNPSDCAPCLSSIDDINNEGGLFYDLPFEVVSVDGAPLLNKTYVVKNQDSLVVEMSAGVGGLIINKTTTFFGDGYEINHSFDVLDDGGVYYGNTSADAAFYVAWLGGLRSVEKDRFFEISQYAQSFIGQEKEIEDLFNDDGEIKPIRNFYSGKTDWAAIRNKYFLNAFISPPSGTVASGGFLGSQSFETASQSIVPEYSMGLKFKKTGSIAIKQFLGPLDVDYISQTNTYLDRVMNFGWLPIQPFSRSVLWLLKKLHAVGLNYGVILILFAVLIRIITGPLSKKSFQSSQNMQKIQPKIKKIQTKYKDDSQRMNREIMKLYTESGVNPLGGCLPMLIQMPLLFSLFIVFRSTIEFRGASFMLWINNLSQPDAVYDLGFSIPIYGQYVAILPVFLGVSMFLSQKLSMQTMDPKQKPMMYIMSGFFFLLFNSFPSGLNLYYMVYNLLNYQQQLSMRKK